MRKMLAILLLTLYITSFTALREVWKLPFLIEHYLEHKAQVPSISVFTFLEVHYMYGSPRDADYARDMQLPFKVVSHTSLISIAIPPSPIYTEMAPVVYSKRKEPILYPSSIYCFNFLSSIWQPPRFC